MKSNKTRFIHLRPEGQPKGGFTLAWKINNETQTVDISVPAICSGEDHYVKATGREIAEKNLLNDHLSASFTFEFVLDTLKLRTKFNINFFSPEINAAINAVKDSVNFDGVSLNFIEQLVHECYVFWPNEYNHYPYNKQTLEICPIILDKNGNSTNGGPNETYRIKLK